MTPYRLTMTPYRLTLTEQIDETDRACAEGQIPEHLQDDDRHPSNEGWLGIIVSALLGAAWLLMLWWWA